MAYKWCLVPLCTNTSIKSPQKLFVSVPTKPKRRKMWLELARRDPKSILPHTNVFMCEDHFDMEKDTINYMQYKMGFSQKILLADEAVPTKFNCQEDSKRRESDAGSSREVLLMKQSESATGSFQKDGHMIQETIEHGGTPPTTKNNVLKEAPVSPQNDSKEEESNSSQISNSLRNKSVRLRNKKAFLLNRRCSVPHCNTRPTNEISLYPCPNIAAVRNEWAEALRVSYQYVKNMVACSLHFTKLDFIQSKNSERVLKHNAVPSRNLQTRKKVMVPVKHKLLKKGASKAFDRQRTMTDTVGQTKEAVKEEVKRECRACLKKLDDKKSCCNVFQAWAPPWDGMEATIAEDLAKLANVEISLTDRHSKVLCAPCYQRLLDAATFASSVRNCDLLLRMRFTADFDMEKVWPKPIQVDKNINGAVFNNTMDIEIKQEILTDDEYGVKRTDNPYADTELANLDIKIEPEELVEPSPLNIIINGTISLDPLNSENKYMKNGAELHQQTQYLQMEVKQEPASESEQDIELTPDLPLECLLCTKSFNSVTGLKAHVIAQHSYKTVKRKADGSVSPEKKRCDQHQCAICKRNFQTSTDLMVHETCHNKHVCYGCNEKFDSFELLTRHRKRCKASIANSVQKLKTLEDVKRPLPGEKLGHVELEVHKLGSETKHDEDIEMKELEPINKDVEMKELNSQENQLESVINTVENDKNIESEKHTLDSVLMKEVDNDMKLESVNEVVVKEKQLESVIEEEESVIEELDNAKKTESVIEEFDIDKKSKSVVAELENANEEDKNESENVFEELEKGKETGGVIEELDNDKNTENVIEEFDIEKKLKSVDAEIENSMESENVFEELEKGKETGCVIKELDNDKNTENVIEEINIDKKLKSVVEELDNAKKSANVIDEIDTDNKLENVIKEFNNDMKTGSLVAESGKKPENFIEELYTEKKSETVIEEIDTDKKSENIIEEFDNDVNTQSVIEDIESDNKNVESEKEVETKQKNMEIENIDDPDSNMNLNLEIQSTHNETESALSDACKPVETLG